MSEANRRVELGSQIAGLLANVEIDMKKAEEARLDFDRSARSLLVLRREYTQLHEKLTARDLSVVASVNAILDQIEVAEKTMHNAKSWLGTANANLGKSKNDLHEAEEKLKKLLPAKYLITASTVGGTLSDDAESVLRRAGLSDG